jgi:hypothetical protein
MGDGMSWRHVVASRSLLLGTAVALGPLYCVVAWLAFHPAVSREYDLYYLKHELRIWPRANGLQYRPGERLDFSKTLPYLSRAGWSDPESWGTWTDGDSASLFLDLPAVPDTDMALHVEGRAFVDTLHPTQSVRVVVNGKNVGLLEYTSQKMLTQTLIVPQHAFSSLQVEIDLIPTHPVAPSDTGASKDTRRLGLGVASILLEPRQTISRRAMSDG